ncbi:hypothetical protein HNQ64_001756 [Prosthecobacter dejongeii]|uniref:Uncharacterized protein n=1 Tax=Prosthecobacter dejongeii TaxID=48465 RepID=A0A7W7YK20_9BACT|nr:hypothetical protein [Prosthecobacter dejongeii]
MPEASPLVAQKAPSLRVASWKDASRVADSTHLERVQSAFLAPLQGAAGVWTRFWLGAGPGVLGAAHLHPRLLLFRPSGAGGKRGKGRAQGPHAPRGEARGRTGLGSRSEAILASADGGVIPQARDARKQNTAREIQQSRDRRTMRYGADASLGE